MENSLKQRMRLQKSTPPRRLAGREWLHSTAALEDVPPPLATMAGRGKHHHTPQENTASSFIGGDGGSSLRHVLRPEELHGDEEDP